MTNKIFHLIVLIGIFISCSGQVQWESYSDDQGRFKIDFKGKPTKKNQSQQFEFADISWKIVEVSKTGDDNLSYSAKYADLPPAIITSDSLEQLDNFFIATQIDLGSTLGEQGLYSINVIQIQKYPGREFRWIDRQSNLGYTRRLFLVKNRLYYLEVKFKLEDNFNKDIMGFLDKFSLLKLPDNSNPESITEKPEKKFEAGFPGKTRVRDTHTLTNLFGNLLAVSEAYETPKDQINSPTVPNLLYGVNYAKLPKDKLKQASNEQVKEFVISAFTDNTQKHSNAKILFQKEIMLDKYWGIEGQVTVANEMAVMHLRAYIVDDYYYQVIVISKNGTQNNKAALDFLNSFKLIQ